MVSAVTSARLVSTLSENSELTLQFFMLAAMDSGTMISIKHHHFEPIEQGIPVPEIGTRNIVSGKNHRNPIKMAICTIPHVQTHIYG